MNVVYVSPNGVGTALVRSQVLAYLRGLSVRGASFDLVTFERDDDPPFPEGEFPRDRWHGIRARHGGGIAAKALDVLRGTAAVFRLAIVRRAALLHARSYLPAAIVWLVTRVVRRPYVFDMRGFLGDEYVEGRHWHAGTWPHRLLRVCERRLLTDAAGIVVLTEAAAGRLRTDARYALAVDDTPVLVTPCAVDLSRFRPIAERPGPPTLVYAGSLGMSYALDAMLGLYATARRHVPALRFLVLNRKDHALVAAAIARLGLGAADIVVRSGEFDEMPDLLASAHAGICLLDQVSSKLASSPIKIGEYLACGLPVVLNRGIGDAADHVEAAGAGHIVETYAEAEIHRAGTALAALVGDERARRAARELAEDRYGVPAGVDAYAGLYDEILARRGGR